MEKIKKFLHQDFFLNIFTVELFVKINKIELKNIYTYSYNVTNIEFYPSNVQANLETYITFFLHGIIYNPNMKCKFNFNDELNTQNNFNFISNMELIDIYFYKCKTHKIDLMNNIHKIAVVYVTLNAIDFYDFRDLIKVKFRQQEIILGTNMDKFPIKIDYMKNLEMLENKYYYSENTENKQFLEYINYKDNEFDYPAKKAEIRHYITTQMYFLYSYFNLENHNVNNNFNKNSTCLITDYKYNTTLSPDKNWEKFNIEAKVKYYSKINFKKAGSYNLGYINSESGLYEKINSDKFLFCNIPQFKYIDILNRMKIINPDKSINKDNLVVSNFYLYPSSNTYSFGLNNKMSGIKISFYDNPILIETNKRLIPISYLDYSAPLKNDIKNNYYFDLEIYGENLFEELNFIIIYEGFDTRNINNYNSPIKQILWEVFLIDLKSYILNIDNNNNTIKSKKEFISENKFILKDLFLNKALYGKKIRILTTYDYQNFYELKKEILTFNPHSILDIFPFVISKDTEELYIKINQKQNYLLNAEMDNSIKCSFENNFNKKTINAKIISNNIISCKTNYTNLGLIFSDNVTYLKLILNGLDEFSNNIAINTLVTNNKDDNIEIISPNKVESYLDFINERVLKNQVKTYNMISETFIISSDLFLSLLSDTTKDLVNFKGFFFLKIFDEIIISEKFDKIKNYNLNTGKYELRFYRRNRFNLKSLANVYLNNINDIVGNRNFDLENSKILFSINLIDWIELPDIYTIVSECPENYFCINNKYINNNKSSKINLPLVTDKDQIIKDYLTSNIFLNSEFICPEGFACNINNGFLYPCPPGTYRDIYSPASSCIICPKGSFCNKEENKSTNKCPKGYSCSETDGNYSLNTLVICPEGFICDENVKFYNIDIYQIILGNLLYPKLCPEGRFCTRGTFSVIDSDYHNGFLKKCLEGFSCQINFNVKNFLNSTEFSGNIHQYGLKRICPIGKICKGGLEIDCPNGTECIDKYRTSAQKCLPGFYFNKEKTMKRDNSYDLNNYYLNSNYTNFNDPKLFNMKLINQISSCLPCPIGTICDGYGNIKPKKCPGGRMCSTSGRYRSNDYCIGGFYCLNSIIGVHALSSLNNKGEDITKSLDFDKIVKKFESSLDKLEVNLINKYSPKFCNEGTYCISGIKTNITDKSNPEAPQNCRQGYLCPQGTSSWYSKKCPAGYYCQGVLFPSMPGQYIPGTGFSNPLLCPPGTFSNETIQTSCRYCPEGYFNDLEGNTRCSICPKGSYRDKDSVGIICIKCPAGSYNNITGATSVNDCIKCPPKYLCDTEGMIDFSEAKACPEGYICREGTNLTNIETCPPGFWCSESTSEIYEIHICDKGYYCDAGSTETNKWKNICLPGYFCVQGSYSKTDSSGQFEGIFLSDILEEVIRAKIDYGIKTGNKWEFDRTICEENKNIPIEFIEDYMLKKILACPSGTTSQQKSYCIGQCTKASVVSVIKSIDPIDPESKKSEKRIRGKKVFNIFNMKLIICLKFIQLT